MHSGYESVPQPEAETVEGAVVDVVSMRTFNQMAATVVERARETGVPVVMTNHNRAVAVLYGIPEEVDEEVIQPLIEHTLGEHADEVIQALIQRSVPTS